MTTSIYKNDTGTQIILDCGATITGASVMKVRAKMPSGGVKTFNATFNNPTSISYITQAGDFDVAGNWELQPYIEMPGWKGRGEWASIEVKD